MSFLCLCCLVLLLTPAPDVDCARILLAGIQYNSHLIQHHVVGEELVRHGHQVYTLVQTPLPASALEGLEAKGLHVLTFPLPAGEEPLIGDVWRSVIHRCTTGDFFKVTEMMPHMTHTVGRDCRLLLADHNVDRLRSLNFDLAIIDGYFFTDCMALLPHRLDVPWVSVSSYHIPSFVGVPALPSVVPPYVLGFPQQMTFFQRVVSTAFWLQFVIFEQAFGNGPSTNVELLKEHAPEVASWGELRKKACLFLQYRDHHLGNKVPTMPHVVHIPGITYRPAKPLPTQLQSILDETSKPVVVFSMGTVVTEFAPPLFNSFMQAFAALEKNITVLMRYNSTASTGYVPENVHMISWLPQNDVLGHEKVKVFITHSGNNGQYEAAYHGVPMLMFPVFGDQQENSFQVERRKMGLTLDLRTFTAKDLEYSLLELVDNSIYERNAKLLGRMLKSRSTLPAEEAADWIEHVLSFGCEHLRAHALDMPWYTVYMVDMWIFFVSLFAVLFYILKGVLYKCNHRLAIWNNKEKVE